MVEGNDGCCQGIQHIIMGDDGEHVNEVAQARWPGSLLLTIVKATVASKLEGYKERLPKRKSNASVELCDPLLQCEKDKKNISQY